jgi:uncharacterized protein
VTRIIVFAKAPVAGVAKTRLIPRLGAAGAATLHAAMVKRTIATAIAAGVGPVELACTPDTSDVFFQTIARDHDVSLSEQGAGDLGDRMCRALARAICEEAAGIVIGTDCACLEEPYLQAADAALAAGAPVVLGPAEDGGYVLIGARMPFPEMFRGIAWGTETVLASTRQALRVGEVTWHELATLWDVDRPADLDRLAVVHPELLRAGHAIDASR